ncbi:mitochondrial small ribosomal subunit protein uS17m [Candidatus Dojkabacteria bacterium]|nr:mitochondrial small ribosomal subunit protein uS17m [Candidatus Dojkabacteria bacterium]
MESKKRVSKTKVTKVESVKAPVKSNRRVIVAKVVSTKMQGTVKVAIESKTMHSVYGKVMNKKRVFFAHTDKQLNEGDVVKIKESRPYSKNVKFVVID